MSEPARTLPRPVEERHLRAVPGLIDASAERLQSYVERLETLAEERNALAADISEVMAEAKLEGFDPKALRLLLRLRKMDEEERTELLSLTGVYARAVGTQLTFGWEG